MDAGKLYGSLFIDFKKAFDIVDHSILLRKLCCYGVNGNAVQLLKSYLTDRTQRCYVKGVLSTEQYVSCGIPQGSIEIFPNVYGIRHLLCLPMIHIYNYSS